MNRCGRADIQSRREFALIASLSAVPLRSACRSSTGPRSRPAMARSAALSCRPRGWPRTMPELPGPEHGDQTCLPRALRLLARRPRRGSDQEHARRALVAVKSVSRDRPDGFEPGEPDAEPRAHVTARRADFNLTRPRPDQYWIRCGNNRRTAIRSCDPLAGERARRRSRAATACHCTRLAQRPSVCIPRLPVLGPTANRVCSRVARAPNRVLAGRVPTGYLVGITCGPMRFLSS